MTLRRKTLLIIVISLLGLLALILVTTRFVILNDYARLEDQTTNTNIKQLLNAFKEDLNSLDSVTEDDSRWDEAYNFVKGTNPNFPDNTFTAESAASLRLNLIMIFDNSGKLMFGTLYDAKQNRQPIPETFLNVIISNTALIHHDTLTSGISGTLVTPPGPILISSHPIRTSLGEGPVVGALIFGRNLDNTEIQRLAGGTLLTTSYVGWSDSQIPSDFETAKTYLSGSTSGQSTTPILILPLNTNIIAGYFVLRDINQKEAVLLKIELPRTLYNRGVANVRLFSLYLIITGLAFAGVFYLLINRTLLAPIGWLNNEVRNLGKRGDFSGRILVTGSDEIANLAHYYNNLMEALASRTHELSESSLLGQRLKQYQAVVDLCHSFNGVLNFQELCDRAVETIQERFVLSFSGVFIAKETSGSALLVAGSGETGRQMVASGFKIPFTSLHPINTAITSRKTNYIPNADSSTLGPLYQFLPTVRSTLDLPLIIEHQVVGVLSLHSNYPDHFDEGDIVIFEGIAASLSTALDSAQTFQAIQKNLEEIRSLHQQYLGSAWAGKAVASGGLRYIYENEQAASSPEGVTKLDLPIELRDQAIGRLVLEIDRPSLSPEEVDLVKTIATDTAIALENTRLLEDTQRRAEREQFLADMSNKVRASTDVDSILRTAILELGRSLRASEGYILLGSDEDNRT